MQRAPAEYGETDSQKSRGLIETSPRFILLTLFRH